MHWPLGIPEAHFRCGPLPPSSVRPAAQGSLAGEASRWPSEHPLWARPLLRMGARRCGRFTSTQERAQTQWTDTHSKLREVRAQGPAGRGPPALFIGLKEPTQKGGLRSEPAWQASVQEAGETGCKGRRPAASLYSEGLPKKKSQLFIKEGRAGPRLGGRGGEQEAALRSFRWDCRVQ